MRDSAGKLAEDFHLLRLTELSFQARALLFQLRTLQILTVIVIQNSSGLRYGLQRAALVSRVSLGPIRNRKYTNHTRTFKDGYS